MTIRRLATLLMIHFCALSLHAAPSDVTATKLLVGTWVNHGHYRSLQDSRTWRFGADGTFSFCTAWRVGDKETRFEELGKWRIKNGVLIQEITGGTEGPLIGSRMRHTVLSINEKQVRFRTQWGEEPTFIRKPVLEI